MKIALAQMEVIPGKPSVNLERMLELIEQAKRQHVDLIAFPEMCVGGYLLGDKWLDDNRCAELMEYNEDLRKASQGIAIAYGNVFLDTGLNARLESAGLSSKTGYHPNKDGRTRRYNAVYVFQDGKPARRADETAILPEGVAPKTLLPTYRFFDDQRYFFSMEDVAKDFGQPLERLTQPFLINVDGRQVKVGFELCEDLWCEDYRAGGQPINPTKMLIKNGAGLIVNASSSPWTYGKNAARDRRIGFLKEQAGDSFVPFLYVNCTGVQNNGKNLIVFDGGSTVYSKAGKPVRFAEAPYKEELLIVETGDLDAPAKERVEKKEIAQKCHAIIEAIKHIKHLTGSPGDSTPHDPKFVHGMSGGVDSAVVAALLAISVGPQNVLGVTMPTKYNSAKTQGAAAHVAGKLGIPFLSVPVGELAKANMDLLGRFELGRDDGKVSEFGEENLTAKLRGTAVLSNIAAENGALYTCNGNKLELAIGYTTLYGDLTGAFAPLADLTKKDVFALARYLNDEIFHEEVIPEALLPDELFRFRDDQIKPSAELKREQIDPMKFGYHDAILEAVTDYKKKSPEDVMRWFLAGTMEENLRVPTELIRRWGVDDPKAFVEDLEWLAPRLENSVFKRVQGPPIVALTKSAYGYDIRESMVPYTPSREFLRLKAKVLATAEPYQPRWSK